MTHQKPYVLSIAGFDPSAGAGVLADVKTFEANGVYGFGVASALTWQNDISFEKVEWIDCYKIIQQAGILLQRFEIKYVKIGLIENMDVLLQLVEYLHRHIHRPVIVFDPILKATAGFVFHHDCRSSIGGLLRHISCITPNIPEAEQIFGKAGLHEKLLEQSKVTNILLKGGHQDDAVSSDTLFLKGKSHVFTNERSPNGAKHGSGCVLSAALAARLAHGERILTAVANANMYTHNFLASNETLLGYHNALTV